MSFGMAIKTVFRKYATFSGRARRSEYWWFSLFSYLVQLPGQVVFFVAYFATIVPAMTDNTNADGTLTDDWYKDINWGVLAGGYAVMLVVSLVLLLPSLGVLVRRLHDTGRSGWWYWLSLVPGGSIVVLVFMFFDSEPGTNQYGPDPKAGERPYGGFPPQGYAQPGYPQAGYQQPGYPQTGYPQAAGGYPAPPAPPAPGGYPAPPAPPLDPFGAPTG